MTTPVTTWVEIHVPQPDLFKTGQIQFFLDTLAHAFVSREKEAEGAMLYTLKKGGPDGARMWLNSPCAWLADRYYPKWRRWVANDAVSFPSRKDVEKVFG